MAKQAKPKPLEAEKQDRIKGKNGGARPGAGRPAFVPADHERQQVEALSGYGLPQDQIAVLIRGGIALETLREYFSKELVSGKAKANGQIGKTLFQKAVGGDTAAMIWWSKSQMRWAETQKLEHTGTDGAPIEIKRIDRVIIDSHAKKVEE